MVAAPKLKKPFFIKHPICCYCGGKTEAATIDHAPAKSIFPLKRRPRGLEFPACNDCNQGAKKHEQVAALMSRLLPDGATKEESKELQDLFRAVGRNIPGFIEELQPDQRQILKASKRFGTDGVAGVLNASGPLVNESIEKFIAKMGFALHYESTGMIIPPEGGVSVRWYTNFQIDEIPPDLFNIIGGPKTLEMGRWNTSESFNYAGVISDNKMMGAYYLTFRLSFAGLAWACMDAKDFPEDAKIYRPGFLINEPIYKPTTKK